MLLPFSDHKTQLHFTLLARSLGFKQGQGRLKTALATQQDMLRYSNECGSVAQNLFITVNFDWHVLATESAAVSCYTCWKHTSSRSCRRHGGKWQKDASKKCRLQGTGRRGWVLDSNVAGKFFTLSKDTTLINQKFQDRFGKVHGVGACEKLHVPVRLF